MHSSTQGFCKRKSCVHVEQVHCDLGQQDSPGSVDLDLSSLVGPVSISSGWEVISPSPLDGGHNE